jgi:hypothetical protein
MTTPALSSRVESVTVESSVIALESAPAVLAEPALVVSALWTTALSAVSPSRASPPQARAAAMTITAHGLTFE